MSLTMNVIVGTSVLLAVLNVLRLRRHMHRVGGKGQWGRVLVAGHSHRVDPMGWWIAVAALLGLLVLVPHAISLVGKAYAPGYHLFFGKGTILEAYRGVTDWVSLLLLGLLGGELFRRWVLKPPHLRPSASAETIIAALSFLMLSNILMEAGQLAKAIAIEAQGAHISAFVAHMLQVLGFGESSCDGLSGWMYWAHAGVAGFLVAWLPLSGVVKGQILPQEHLNDLN